MSEQPQLSDVTWTRFILNLTTALSDKLFRWAALVMACGVTVYAMVHPEPVRAGVAGLFVVLISPLWLRRDKENENA